MGTHLIMRHKGDKKANKEQQGCRQAAALRSVPEAIRALHYTGDCRVTWSHQGQDLGILVALRTLLISQGNSLSSLIFMQLV